MPNAYAMLGLMVVACSGAYLTVAIASVVRFRRRLDAAPRRADLPVTVLKPLCGAEVDLERNLRSFCDQDYGTYQVIFAVRDPHDPAIAVVEALIAAFPDTDIALVVDERVHGANLKISNLANMMPQAKHDILVISDSDMRVGRDYLQTVAATFADPRVGAATCLYSGSAGGGMLSRLGAMFINDWFLPSALIPALRDELTFCFGATMAVRRDALEAFGGFAALADVLADDYMLGNLVTQQGSKVALVPYVVDNLVFEPSLMALFLHEVRWARTIRNVKPMGYALATVTDALPLAVAAAGLFHLAAWPAWAVWSPLAAMIVLRLALHLAVHDTIKGRGTFAPWLIPLRDLLSLCVRIAAYFGTTVHWRDQVLTVRDNSYLEDASLAKVKS